MSDLETLHIYTRVSTTTQEEEGTSLQTQLEEGIKRSEKLGWNYKHWNEGGASSSKDDLSNRPVLTELLTRVDEGEIKHLYVWNTDRLSRNGNTWGMIRFKLIQNDVVLHTPTGKQHLSDPQTNLLIGIMSEISQYDNKLRTERFRLGKLSRVRNGGWFGGPPPFGYEIQDSKLIVNEYESKWVKEIIDMYIDKVSVDDIRTHLMKNGVMTRRNNPIWSHGSIRKLLSNTHFSGTYTFTDKKSGETNTLYCDSIITPQTYKKLKQEIKKREYKGSGSTRKQSWSKHTHVLQGLLKCGCCGSFYRIYYNPKQYNKFYFCPTKENNFKNTFTDKYIKCGTIRPTIKMEHSDELVWNTVIDVISNSYIFKESIKSEILEKQSYSKTQKEIERIKVKLKRIDNDLRMISETLLSLDTNELLREKVSDKHYKEIQEKERDIQHQRELVLSEMGVKEESKKWVDWVKQFGDKITDLRDNKLSNEEKNKFLSGIVKEIVVNSIDKTNHDLVIQFNMKYVNDQIKKNGTNRGYELVEGVDSVTIPSKKGAN